MLLRRAVDARLARSCTPQSRGTYVPQVRVRTSPDGGGDRARSRPARRPLAVRAGAPAARRSPDHRGTVHRRPQERRERRRRRPRRAPGPRPRRPRPAPVSPRATASTAQLSSDATRRLRARSDVPRRADAVVSISATQTGATGGLAASTGGPAAQPDLQLTPPPRRREAYVIDTGIRTSHGSSAGAPRGLRRGRRWRRG